MSPQSEQQLSDAKAFLSTLKFGFIEDLNMIRPYDGHIRAAYSAQINGLKQLNLVPKALSLKGVDFAKTRRAGLIAVELELYRQFREVHQEAKHGISETLAGLLDWFQSKGKNFVDDSTLTLEQIAQRYRQIFKDIDFLILPTLPEPIPLLGEDSPSGIADFTATANIAGLPAVSFPLAQIEKDKPPISMQILGKKGSDTKLLHTLQCLKSMNNAKWLY